MSITLLERHIPVNSIPFLKKWFGSYALHIKITGNRKSKLGDYCKKSDKTHQITINGTLPPPLFFFVLSHELAHLIAFETHGPRIAPHGIEWKNTYREMILESLQVYEPDLQMLILEYARAPKANFMASPKLVKYFHVEDYEDETSYLEDLKITDRFTYRQQIYQIDGIRKKNYLCTNIKTEKKYIFKPLARVEKVS